MAAVGYTIDFRSEVPLTPIYRILAASEIYVQLD